MYKLLVCFTFVLIMTVAAFAQKTYSGTVQVRVISTKDTPPNDMAKTIESEINSFVDVKVKEKEADYAIYVYLEKIPSNGPAFYALTFNFFKNADCSYKNAIVDGKVVRTDCSALAQVFTVTFLPEADMKAKAKEIVTLFSKGIIEPERRAFQKNKSF